MIPAVERQHGKLQQSALSVEAKDDLFRGHVVVRLAHEDRCLNGVEDILLSDAMPQPLTC